MTDELLPPHNQLAEEHLLCSIITDPETILDISELVHADDFYSVRNKELYLAISSLHAENVPVDFITLCDALERDKKIDKVGGKANIARIIKIGAQADNVENYANIIARSASNRRLLTTASKIATLAYSEEDDAISQAQSLLHDLALGVRGKEDFVTLFGAANDYLDEIQNHRDNPGQYNDSVPTGFFDLDMILGGMQRQNLIIVGARTSQGKTAQALSLASNAATLYGKSVAIFSIEMSKEEIVKRFFSIESGVDSAKIRDLRFTKEDAMALGNAYSTFKNTNIFINDSATITVSEIRSKVKKLSIEHPLDLIIIDYIQLISGNNKKNRVEELGEISRGLKALAKEMNVPIVALAQLSRAIEARKPPIPMLSDLRESGNLEQDADVVLFIYREDLYDEESERKNIADIYIAKHRNGSTGKVSLYFDNPTACFRNLERA